MEKEEELFENAIANINFAEGEDCLLLFLYMTFEVNKDDVRFYIEKSENGNFLYLHFQSDNIIPIRLESESILKRLECDSILKIFEIDTMDGEMFAYYNAKS